MSRFSPTVRPSSRPGGLGGLAAALQEGVGAYRDTQDRAEAQRDRERQRVIQTDTLASQGMTPQFADAPESFGSALSRAMAGQPAPAPRRAVAPGAFKPWDGDFEKPDPMTGRPQEQMLPTMRLPSGGTYDPNVPLQREGASLMQKGRIGNQVESEAQDLLAAKLRPGLERMGAPTEAGLLPGAASGWLGYRDPKRLQFVGENQSRGALWVDPETGETKPVSGTTPLPRTSREPGRVQLSVGQRKELSDMTYYQRATEQTMELLRNRPESVGLDMVQGVKLADRTDPHGVRVRARIAQLSNDIRKGKFGTALSKQEAALAAQEMADPTNTEASAMERLQAILDWVENRKFGIYQGAMDAAAFERTGVVPDRADAEPETPPKGPVDISAFRPRRVP